MAQLVERLLAILEFRGSNSVIRKIYIEHLFTVNCIEKTKIKKKEAGNGPFKKKQNKQVSHTVILPFKLVFFGTWKASSLINFGRL